jgi:RND family efflux transporter MFP subunit
MKNKLILVLVLLLIVGAAVVLLKTRKAGLAEAPVAAVLPVVVEALRPEVQQISLTLPVMGVVSSDLSTTLSTKISGRLDKLYKREGDPVRAGELIAQIDNDELLAKRMALLAKIEGLDAEIRTQEESHARTLELFAVGGAALEQKQQEETALERLSLERQSLRQNIAELDQLTTYARIVAPVSGTLSAALVKVGDLALPGKPLFKISASEGLFLDIKLPATVEATAIRYQGQIFPLTAKNLAGASGLREYRAQLPLGNTLVEGEFLNVDLLLYTGEGLLLPNDVLLTSEGQTSVMVYQDGLVRKTPVSVTRRGREGVMVKEDLAGKTLLLAKPDILLRAASGTPVTILQPGKA